MNTTEILNSLSADIVAPRLVDQQTIRSRLNAIMRRHGESCLRNVKSAEGRGLLHSVRWAPLTEALIHVGRCNPNERDNFGNTPLFQFARDETGTWRYALPADVREALIRGGADLILL
jgi:hypothetical protein